MDLKDNPQNVINSIKDILQKGEDLYRQDLEQRYGVDHNRQTDQEDLTNEN